MAQETIHAPKSRRAAMALTAGIFVLILIGLTLGVGVWAQGFKDRIGPHAFIGVVDVSGMTAEEARSRIQQRVDDVLTDGVALRLRDKTVPLPLASTGADGFDRAQFDINGAIETMRHLNRSEN